MTACERHNIYIYIRGIHNILRTTCGFKQADTAFADRSVCGRCSALSHGLDDATGMENRENRVQMAVHKKNILYLR